LQTDIKLQNLGLVAFYDICQQMERRAGLFLQPESAVRGGVGGTGENGPNIWVPFSTRS